MQCILLTTQAGSGTILRWTIGLLWCLPAVLYSPPKTPSILPRRLILLPRLCNARPSALSSPTPLHRAFRPGPLSPQIRDLARRPLYGPTPESHTPSRTRVLVGGVNFNVARDASPLSSLSSSGPTPIVIFPGRPVLSSCAPDLAPHLLPGPDPTPIQVHVYL